MINKFYPEEWNSSMWAELKFAGITYSPEEECFIAVNDKITAMNSIKDIYTKSPTTMTAAQRRLRGELEKLNLDLVVKRIGNILHVINTNNITYFNKIKPIVKKFGYSPQKICNGIRLEVRLA